MDVTGSAGSMCVDRRAGMLLRNISLNIAKNPCLTRVFVAWHHGVKKHVLHVPR